MTDQENNGTKRPEEGPSSSENSENGPGRSRRTLKDRVIGRIHDWRKQRAERKAAAAFTGGGIMERIRAFFRLLLSWITWPFRRVSAFLQGRSPIVRLVVIAILAPFIASWLWLFWITGWIRDFDPARADALIAENVLKPQGMAQEGAEGAEKSCGRSAIVAVAADLVDFNINRNRWVSASPVYKFGLLGIPWSYTPFFDNKAAFQRGVMQAVIITAIELADTLGRVRGTSRQDVDLRAARAAVNVDPYRWIFNPFDARLPLITSPATADYKRAIAAFHRFNDRLERCEAVFDARADNLLQFVDRVAKDIGATSARLKDRAEASNAGWFDFRADDTFWFALGQLYGYAAILKAARADFSGVVRARNLDDIWDNLQDHLNTAIGLDPLIVSNGAEDGLLFPSHLTALGFYALRARANLVEIRAVLDR
ncbi:DUF2333 family protein [Thermopetrobacter sp. TC1]|uniref:DUF2333 family protein n=1 Tax=Thermopetrobacter sp. TC1 TaxID=1495045 RepID=UPI00068C7B69|nr:DUF2333 family protein [Thermopetrobacter sp. TC1]